MCRARCARVGPRCAEGRVRVRVGVRVHYYPYPYPTPRNTPKPKPKPKPAPQPQPAPEQVRACGDAVCLRLHKADFDRVIAPLAALREEPYPYPYPYPYP